MRYWFPVAAILLLASQALAVDKLYPTSIPNSALPDTGSSSGHQTMDSGALPPPQTNADLGKDRHTIVHCEGYVDTVVNVPYCDFAKSMDHRCTVVTVHKCPAWKKIEYVECMSDGPRPSLVDKFDAFHLKDFATEEIEVADKIMKKGIKDANQIDIEHMKLIEKRPRVSVAGVLEDCVISQDTNSYPLSQCTLSACTAEFVDEPVVPAKKKKKN